MSRSFIISPALWACLVLTAPAVAQEGPPPVPAIATAVPAEPEISLDELLRRALANNPQLPLARGHLEAARERAKGARARSNPVLQVIPGLGGTAEARDEEILLSQPVDLFGRRRAKAGVADTEVRRAGAESALAERNLVVNVKTAAAELFAAQEAETLGQVQLEVAQLFRDAAARRAQLGDVPPVQAQRAELELLRMQNELAVAQAERVTRRATLNQLAGQAPETPLRVAIPLSGSGTDLLRVPTAGTALSLPAPGANAAPASDVDLADVRAQLLPALTARPDILGAQASVEGRRAQAQVLRRERLPELQLQARRSAVTGSGSTALRAVITMPLFDFGSNKRERQALEAEARAGEAQISLLRSQAALQVEQALVRLRQHQQMVERYRNGILPLTLDLLRKTQIGYAQGASSYLEVLEAQRTLRQVQTEYLQALAATRTSEAQLESALGSPLPAPLAAQLSLPIAAKPQGAAQP